MSSPYKRLRDKLGLDDNSGTSMNLHFVSLLLLALGDDDEAHAESITYSDDDAKEILHRLRLRGYRGFAMQEMERLLSPRVR